MIASHLDSKELALGHGRQDAGRIAFLTVLVSMTVWQFGLQPRAIGSEAEGNCPPEYFSYPFLQLDVAVDDNRAGGLPGSSVVAGEAFATIRMDAEQNPVQAAVFVPEGSDGADPVTRVTWEEPAPTEGTGPTGGMMGGRAPGAGLTYDWLAPGGADGFGLHKAVVDFCSRVPPSRLPPLTLRGSFGVYLLDAPGDLGLPSNLYLTSIGIGLPMRSQDDTVIMLQTDLRMSGEFAADSLQLVVQAMGQSQVTERVTLMMGAGMKMLCNLNQLGTDELQPTFNALARFQKSDTLQLLVGAGYMGNDAPWPVMPIAGLTWTPRDDFRADLVMPKPRLSYRIVDWGEIEWWTYLGGGMGGESWYVERADGVTRPVRYSQFRVSLGVERKVSERISTNCEVGYVLGRRVEIDDEDLERELDGTLSLATSLRY